MRGRHEPVPPPAYCGAQRALLRAAGALLPVRLLATATDLTAGLRGLPALPRSPAAEGLSLRVPRGAILCRWWLV